MTTREGSRRQHRTVLDSLRASEGDWTHRYDPDTPIEETLEALHDLVKSGKVRYVGASSMHAWQFVQAQYVADLHGWTRFVSMQDHYNLLMREIQEAVVRS